MSIIRIVGGSYSAKMALYHSQSKKRSAPTLTIVEHGEVKVFDVQNDLKVGETIIEHKSKPTVKILFRDGTFIIGRMPASLRIQVMQRDKTRGWDQQAALSPVVAHDFPNLRSKQHPSSSGSGWATVIILGLIIWGISSCVSGSDKTTPAPVPKPVVRDVEIDKIDAKLFCKNAVEASLKAPSTAKFPWMDYDIRVTPDQTEFFVKSYVDSENSYGAMLRTTFLCRLKYNGGNAKGWVLEDLVINP